MAPIQFLFMGTGTSTGLPLTPCLTLSHSYPEAFTSHVPRPRAPAAGTRAAPGHFDPKGPWPRNIECACCRSAVDPEVPEGWKNKRGNTSAVVRHRGQDGRWRNILVDCGKTFLEQARTYFPKWGVQTIDAVLLTHGHADAYFGLDDLREWCVRQRRAIPIYLDKPTFDIVAASFPYLVDSSRASGGGDVPTLLWNVIDELSEFDVCDLHVRSFPVHHGVYFSDPAPRMTDKGTSVSVPTSQKSERHPLICQSFMFDDKVLYMGDVSEIPDRTWRALGVQSGVNAVSEIKPQSNGLYTPASTPTRKESGANGNSNGPGQPPPDLPVFIVDALWPLRSHASHFSLAQAMEASLQLKPSVTYTIGSTHPTTHFMWEEVCRSFVGQDGQRQDHPDAEISRGLVKRVKGDPAFSGSGGIAEQWAEWRGKIEPGYDGLILQIEDNGECKEVEMGGVMAGI